MLSQWDVEQRNKLPKATKNQVKNDSEVKLSHWDPEQRNRQLETVEKHLPPVCQKDEPK